MEDTFVIRARRRASQWKSATPTLPEAARGPAAYLRDGCTPQGMYPFCLPAGYASYNLLPDVRAGALRVFAAKGIAWHAETALGPTNHLLSSQVQCVNALEPMAHDPARIVAAFGAVLPIGEPLPIEGDRYVTYEWIGEADYLGEADGGPRRRGTRVTSADAAIRYRTPSGSTEIALIEWKYVEDYRGHELSRDRAGIRPGRYRKLWDADDSPLRTDLIPYDDMFVEPFYQLMRQQLLAHEMERAGELGADVVRVLHVSPTDNEGLRGSLNRSSHLALGDDVFDVWRQLLRQPDRFVSLDSRELCRTASAEYAARYDSG
jgi:hypothetical protein